MFSKIDITKILSGHWSTLCNQSGKANFGDVILFCFLPLIVATALVFSGHLLKESSVSVLLASYAILTGLLFNLLVLVFDLIRKEGEPTNVDSAAKAGWQLKQQLLKQTFASISFCVLEGIGLSVITLAALLPWKWCQLSASVFVYAVTTNFALTLLMILKRIHALLESEFPAATKK